MYTKCFYSQFCFDVLLCRYTRQHYFRAVYTRSLSSSFDNHENTHVNKVYILQLMYVILCNIIYTTIHSIA